MSTIFMLAQNPRLQKLMIALILLSLLGLMLVASINPVAAGSVTSGSYCAC